MELSGKNNHQYGVGITPSEQGGAFIATCNAKSALEDTRHIVAFDAFVDINGTREDKKAIESGSMKTLEAFLVPKQMGHFSIEHCRVWVKDSVDSYALVDNIQEMQPRETPEAKPAITPAVDIGNCTY